MADRGEFSADDEMPSSLREMLNSGSQLDFFNEDIVKMKNSGAVSFSDHNNWRFNTEEDKAGSSSKLLGSVSLTE
jgi:hypothetical protein